MCWIPTISLFRQLGMGHRQWLLFLLGRHEITLGQDGDKRLESSKLTIAGPMIAGFPYWLILNGLLTINPS
jgi:hypothetical protein